MPRKIKFSLYQITLKHIQVEGSKIFLGYFNQSEIKYSKTRVIDKSEDKALTSPTMQRYLFSFIGIKMTAFGKHISYLSCSLLKCCEW